jgi:hypothetical protein
VGFYTKRDNIRFYFRINLSAYFIGIFHYLRRIENFSSRVRLHVPGNGLHYLDVFARSGVEPDTGDFRHGGGSIYYRISHL